MKVLLTMNTEEVDISSNAKICYGTKSDKDITYSLVHKRHHLSALRFAYATFNIEGISRACANQLVRSSHLEFMQESMRYVDADKGEFEFILPNNVDDLEQMIMKNTFVKALGNYKYLISKGVKKEDARAILPLNTSTKINVTGNLQAYYSFFKLRLDKHAQEEIRELANRMYLLLQDKFPQVFNKELYHEFTK